MPELCPACGAESPPGATECPGCGLAAGLFEPVRRAALASESDPSELAWIRELLAAAGVGPGEPAEPEPGPASLARPARFPAPPRPQTPPEVVEPRSTPPLPALEPGEPGEVLRREVLELMTLARRLDAELAGVPDRLAEALRSGSLSTLDDLRRELFVRDASALTEMIEIAAGRRSELAALLST
ncbi:MAG: hypothetical protein ACREC5_02670, partial [Thermoplasmata archaeon]